MTPDLYNRIQNFFKYQKFFIIVLMVISGLLILVIGIYVKNQNDSINSFDNQKDLISNKLQKSFSTPSSSYLNSLHYQDSQTLVWINNNLKPLYNDLFNLIDNKINNDSKSIRILSDHNSTSLFEEVKKRDSLPKSIDNPLYGLDSNQEIEKRHILNEIYSRFSNEHKETILNNLIYIFMATPKCEMYIMEPFSPMQTGLDKGIYKNHPWCPEFDKNAGLLGYITEPYYANTAKHKVSTVILPIISQQQGNKSVVFYLGGTLNIHEFMNKMLYTDSNLNSSNLKVMLLVQHDKNKPVLYEPWFENSFNPQQNTSFTTSEDNVIIDNIIKSNSSNPKFFKLNGSDYIVTASTGEKFLFPNDINRQRGVTWDWVILRQLPDFKDIKTTPMENPFGSFFKDNLVLLISMFLLLGSGILICVFILKRYFTKKHNILIEFRTLVEEYRSNRIINDDINSGNNEDISETLNREEKKD